MGQTDNPMIVDGRNFHVSEILSNLPFLPPSHPTRLNKS